MDEETNQKTKKSGLIIVIIIIFLILAGIIGTIIYFKFFSKTEVDLSKYVSFEMEDSYEGTASFDENDIVIDEDGLKDLLDSKSLAQKLSEKITDKIKVEENEKLKNGDEVKVKVKISSSWLDDRKIKIKDTSFNIKIENLEEPKSIDVFKDLDISYSGISPNLTVYVDTKSDNDFIINNIKYKLRKESDDENDEISYSLNNVKNGDKIVVRADYYESSLENSGYILNEDENTYTFTVKNQAEYITDSKKLSDKVQEELKEEFLSEVKDKAERSDYNVSRAYKSDFSDIGNYNYNFTHSDPEFQSMYLAVNDDIKEKDKYIYDYNVVYGIYKVVYTDTVTSKNYDFYIAAKVENVVVEKNKLYDNYYYFSTVDNSNFEVNGEDYRKTADGIYQAIVDEVGDDYTLTEIKAESK